MRILIADKLSTQAIDALRDIGANIMFKPDFTAEDLPNLISDFEVLIVRSTKVTTETIKAAQNLSLIIRAGAGVNTIDLQTASEKGIYVANCPGENTAAVAELAMGLLIAADRRIVNATVDLRNGQWNKKEYGKAAGLKGRTLGVIGLGSIGKAVVRRAQGLNMNVIGWSRSLTPEIAEELGIEYCETIYQLAQKSDAVSVHLAASPETKQLLDAKFFSKMKDDAIFINTARGDVVKTEDLKKAIESQNLRVGLDVYENEPAGGKADFPDTALADLVTATPHIGASTDQASEAIAAAVVRIVKAYKDTGKPLNAVNLRMVSTATRALIVRHFNKVGVLVSILSEIRSEGINIEEMENTIFENGQAASVTLKLDGTPSDAVIEKIQQQEHIIQVSLK